MTISISAQKESVANSANIQHNFHNREMFAGSGQSRYSALHHPGLAMPSPMSGSILAPHCVSLTDYEVKARTASSSSRLEKILQLLPAGVVLLDSTGMVSDCNLAAEELLGSPLKGNSWRDIIAERFNPRMDDGHEISLKNGKRVSLVTRSLGDEPGQIIVLNDLTETRQLQQQLSRHQRLSAMGRMVSSLAHQIRTPLSAALLYADSLRASKNQNEVTTRYSEKIMSRLQNIERQIRDMLIFARGEEQMQEEIEVSELAKRLQEAASDIQHPNAHKMEWDLHADEASLVCNSDAIVGAVLNLLENALHASDNAERVALSLSIIKQEEDADESCLCIAVEDEGTGIGEELLQKLEEPFVTTKSHGTGLGLSVVKLVAKAHEGYFYLTPKSEGGMLAEIVLPVNTAGRQ